jgi:fatty acid desaturase
MASESRSATPAHDLTALQQARLPTKIRPWIYWLDLLVSAGVGWGGVALVATGAVGPGVRFVATLGATLALLRALTFVHEIAHRAREIPGFEVVWHLGVGIPLAVPSLLYVGSHPSHHRSDRFGTRVDPEYAPIARWGASRKLLFVAASGLAPLALVLRWGVLGPLSLVIPRLRREVVGRLSTLAINPGYDREPPRGADRRRWICEEIAAAAWVWSAGLAFGLGGLPLAWLGTWFVVVSGIFIVNQTRTLLAHRYALEDGPVDEQGQLLDTLTLPPRSWLAALIAPLGLRYHALHHWAPGIPYHDLGRVHRRIVAEAQPRAPYLRTLTPSLAAGIRKQLGRPSSRV